MLCGLILDSFCDTHTRENNVENRIVLAAENRRQTDLDPVHQLFKDDSRHSRDQADHKAEDEQEPLLRHVLQRLQEGAPSAFFNVV